MIELSPLPYETVYSWVARYHFKVGVGHEKNTFRALFGKEKLRIHPYLPNSLSCLNDLGSLSSDDWINEHTLYPLFKFFNEDNRSSLKAAMFESASNTIAKASIPQARLTLPYGHFYCSDCCQESRTKQGFSWFDIRHQIPGLLVCPFHDCQLSLIEGGDIGIDRSFCLPRETSAIRLNNARNTKFALYCLDVLELCKSSKAVNIEGVYREYLERKGYITHSGQLRISMLVSDLEYFYRYFVFSDGLNVITSFKFLGPLLRNKTHFPCHPLKHLVFSFWLFGGKASYFQYEQTRHKTNATNPAVSPVKHNFDIDIIHQLKSGSSLASIEKSTGKSRCYIRRISELNNIGHGSNKLAYSKAIRHAVLIQAQLGRHRKNIAQSLNLGVGYVEQVISNTRGVSQWRKQLTKLKKLTIAMKEIKEARSEHSNWFRKDIKKHCNQAFFYLYRHARTTLEAMLPQKTIPHVPIRSWQAEDERLFEAISALPDVNKLSLTAIGHKVKDHAHLRRKLNCLPKTKAQLIKLGKIK